MLSEGQKTQYTQFSSVISLLGLQIHLFGELCKNYKICPILISVKGPKRIKCSSNHGNFSLRVLKYTEKHNRLLDNKSIMGFFFFLVKKKTASGTTSNFHIKQLTCKRTPGYCYILSKAILLKKSCKRKMAALGNLRSFKSTHTHLSHFY